LAVSKNKKHFNTLVQFAIPILTILTQVAIALKYPQWGLLFNICAQPFWIYSGWKAYKKAGQIGLFATTVIVTFIMLFGIINYWVF